MKGLRIVFVVIAVVVIGVAVYFGVSRKKGEIVIGGKNFTEQSILGEMAAILIEEKTGLSVKRNLRLATNLPTKLLERGDIDLYLDYTGTGYVDILGIPYKQESPEQIYAHLNEVYPERFNAEWLSPLGFANSYTLTMRRAHAEELEITKISDLAQHTDLRAGFDPAFINRDDGYPGLVKQYGFKFDEPPTQLAIGMMYRQCLEGQIDVIDAFSTDGRIGRFDLKILEDDKSFFPPYDAAFVVRTEVLKLHPDIRDALELLAGKIDTATMQRLNYAVDEGGKAEADVARDFLVAQGLITATTQPAAD